MVFRLVKTFFYELNVHIVNKIFLMLRLFLHTTVSVFVVIGSGVIGMFFFFYLIWSNCLSTFVVQLITIKKGKVFDRHDRVLTIYATITYFDNVSYVLLLDNIPDQKKALVRLVSLFIIYISYLFFKWCGVDDRSLVWFIYNLLKQLC